jgi:hypothetical protein
MTQRELNRAVARATGESVDEIAHLCFVPLHAVPREFEPEDHDLERHFLDWEWCDGERNVPLVRQRSLAVA